jgi:glycosyltransferase involved in cell wall biosynthesis
MVQSYYPRKVQRRSVVIPNAIAENIPEPDRDAEKIRKEIVGVGRFTEQKNFEILIESFAVVYREHPDYTLIIYGDGPLRKKYEDQIKRLGLSDAVRMPGYLENVNERMRYASIYVNSSNYEGISNAMLEAMAMGIPCVCTDCPVGGASLVIKNEHNGILVPIGNQKVLSEAILKLINDNTLCHRIENEAIKIRIMNSVGRIGNQWLNIVRNLGDRG